MNPLTMTNKELIEHASKQVQALRMALDMIECEKYERRHVRWAIIDALKEEAAAQPAPDHIPDTTKMVAAQRTWVEITEEDLKLLSAEWRIVYGAWMDDFARDIEAKLKEKNT